MRDVIYSPPDGEGPTVVVILNCQDCIHYRLTPGVSHARVYCEHPDVQMKEITYSPESPSWCPIVQADHEAWEKRLRG